MIPGSILYQHVFFEGFLHARKPGANGPYGAPDGKSLRSNGKIDEKIDRNVKNTLKIFVPYLREKSRFRFLIEKLSELNVNEIHIGVTKNTQNINYSKSKIKEWLVSALEQSGSAYLPDLFFPENINFNDFTTCFNISGETFDKNAKKLNNFAIGPEGGWTDEELSKFQHKIKISEFSLRTETAAITAVSLMM